MDLCEDKVLSENILKLNDILKRAQSNTDYKTSFATMLTNKEQHLLYLLAKEYYSGEGSIFDGGVCTGGDTQNFAKGLHNANWEKKHIIYSYENGVISGTSMCNFLKRKYNKEYAIGDSFLDITIDTLSHCLGNEYIYLQTGDILEKEYPEKIEILFLDVCKTPELNHAMMQLLERCIPGKTLVIQQDYKWYGTPWINVSMGYLKEYFYTVQLDIPNTQVFLLKKPIPKKVLMKDTWSESDLKEQLNYFAAHYDYIHPYYRLQLEQSKALIYKKHGLEKEAELLLDNMATIISLYQEVRLSHCPIRQDIDIDKSLYSLFKQEKK